MMTYAFDRSKTFDNQYIRDTILTKVQWDEWNLKATLSGGTQGTIGQQSITAQTASSMTMSGVTYTAPSVNAVSATTGTAPVMGTSPTNLGPQEMMLVTMQMNEYMQGLKTADALIKTRYDEIKELLQDMK